MVGLIGLESRRRGQRARGSEFDAAVRAASQQGIAEGLKSAAGAFWEMGKGALGDIFMKQVESLSYQLSDDSFEVTGLTARKRIEYASVSAIRSRGNDRFDLEHETGVLVIKPVAHLVAGRLKVPVGWARGGMEVPYMTLVEELAGRCGVDIEWA